MTASLFVRLRRGLARLVRDGSGNTAVEFALVLPVTLLALLGFLQCGLMMYDHNTLQYATEQAARYAMAHTAVTNQEISNVILAQATGLDPNLLTVQVAQTALNGVPCVKISSSYSFSFLAGLLPFGQVTLSGMASVPLGT